MGGIYSSGMCEDINGDQVDDYSQSLQAGDTVTMIVDIKRGENRFYVNGKDKGVISSNIDFKKKLFKMAMIGSEGFTIKLKNFTKSLDTY